MVPPEFIQELLSRVDIVAVVGRHVELKKAGSSVKGLCPFHGEKSPSFHVSAARQRYHCFGCGVDGDALRFMTEYLGFDFITAVEDLAQQVGMKVPQDQRAPAEIERASTQREKRDAIVEVLCRAETHYRRALKASPRAVAYLEGRGLTGRVAANFGLGYAGDSGRGLAGVFPTYDDPLLVEAGLVIVREEAGEAQRRYDRFRDRIMFPIRSVQGQVIGFGARVIDHGEPKYLNSPETPVFVKGRELYGLFEARPTIKATGFALVVEGYMDVVVLAQAGIANAVATLGTACTADHLAKLFRFTDAVVFSFDGDAAGRRAASRALEAALPLASDLRTIRFLFLPAEHDPDSYVRVLGRDAFDAAVAQAVPLSRQFLEHCAQGCDTGTAEGRARLLAQARPLFAQLPEGALRPQLLRDLANLAQLTVEEVQRLWGQVAPAKRVATAPGTSAGRPVRRPGLRASVRRPQDNIAAYLLVHNEWWEALPAAEHDALIALDDWHGELFAWLDRHIIEHGPTPWPGLRGEIASQSWAASANALLDGVEVPHEPSFEDLLHALRQLVDARQQPDLDRALGRR
jgi:DNA primase